MSEVQSDKSTFSKRVNLVEYKHWKNMRRKCYATSYKGYHLYGAKGVRVCDRWWDFTKFMEDVGVRPTPRHTIALRPGASEFGPKSAKWMTPEEYSKLGERGASGNDDSDLVGKPGDPGLSGPSSIADFSSKRESYIHCFIGLLCPKCGGKLWIHPATVPESDGFSKIQCFECERDFLWKRTDTIIAS